MAFKFRRYSSKTLTVEESTLGDTEEYYHINTRQAFLELINDWNRRATLQATTFKHDNVWIYVAV